MGMLAVSAPQEPALFAAVLAGGGLSLAAIAMLTRVRNKQRSLAAILDDTMGEAPIPVEVVSESPPAAETSALTVRVGQAFARFDTRGHLEQRLERADIPFRAGEYLVISTTLAIVLALAGVFVVGSPLAGLGAAALVVGIAWWLPSFKVKQRV